MKTFLRILLMGLGLPAIAREIRHHGQQVSDKLSIVTFLTERHRIVAKIAVFALLGSMLTVTGLSMGLISLALSLDLRPSQPMTFTIVSSLFVLVIGLIFGSYAWSKAKKLEKEFAVHQTYSQHQTSLTRTILSSVLNAVVGNPFESSKKIIN